MDQHYFNIKTRLINYKINYQNLIKHLNHEDYLYWAELCRPR